MGLLLFFGFITLCSTAIEAKKETDCIIAEDVCPNKHVTFSIVQRIKNDEPVKGTEKPYVSNQLKFKVLIHGYKGNGHDKSMDVLSEAYLNKNEYFMVIVDWGKLAKKDCYKEALRNYLVVGKCTAEMVNMFKEGKTPVNSIHVIGFGLGAHVAGVVGHAIQNVDRITGLDPALKGFSGNSTRLEDRLDSSDAVFVDVYHSNSGEEGMQEPLGDTDFYLNNGKSQPGCISSTCSHYRVVDVFAESITYPLGFIGRPCILGPKRSSRIRKYFGDVCPLSPILVYIHTFIRAGEDAKKGSPGTFKVLTNDKPYFAISRNWVKKKKEKKHN